MRNDNTAVHRRLRGGSTAPGAAPSIGLAAALGLALGAAGCARRDEPAPPPSGAPVRVDGSSTVYPVSKAIAEEVLHQGMANAAVNQSGTTGGFKKFCANETDISDASRPIETSEIEACHKAGVEFIELPIGYDGLAVVVNANNSWVDSLTVGELKTIWAPEAAGVITSWKQVRASFPDRPLHLFGPGGDSGTFDYFTQAIIGTQRASRHDYTASEDDSVLVHGIEDDDSALGYFGYAYVVRSQGALKAVAIDDGVASNGDGPVAPSTSSVAHGTYQPLSRPIFIYVNVASLKRPEVEKFVAFYLQVAHELSAEVGYVSLPSRVDQLARDRFRTRKTGSLFSGGSPPIGVTMERLLEAQTTQE